MYTPEEIRINHPTYFEKCLSLQMTPQKKLACREREIVKDAFSSPIISYIGSTLPIAGILKQDDRGFIYLDVADEYITSIIPFFNDPAIDLPPFFSGEFQDGAHIAIATCDEEKKLFNRLPVGEAFSFSITGCFRSSITYDIQNKYVWYLTVSSDELCDLRESVGLTRLPGGESFYITLAYKKTFLSLNDLITDATQNRITLSESAVLLNKLRDASP